MILDSERLSRDTLNQHVLPSVFPRRLQPWKYTGWPCYITGFRSETVEKVAMTRLIRSLSDDSAAGHVEVESREESRQSGLIRHRSRKAVR